MNELAIKAEKLSKNFGSFKAVDEISFDVKKGEVFGFLGANGAGKTTAMKMLIGISTPSSGKASIAGYDIYNETEKIKRNIGYMSQKFSLYDDLTIGENLRFFGGIYGLRIPDIKLNTEKVLNRLHLQKEKNAFFNVSLMSKLLFLYFLIMNNIFQFL